MTIQNQIKIANQTYPVLQKMKLKQSEIFQQFQFVSALVASLDETPHQQQSQSEIEVKKVSDFSLILHCEPMSKEKRKLKQSEIFRRFQFVSSSEAVLQSEICKVKFSVFQLCEISVYSLISRGLQGEKAK